MSFQQIFRHNLSKSVLLLLIMIGVALLSGVVKAAALADIKNTMVSARDVGTSAALGFDIRATGLNTVGIGKTVYLTPAPKPEAAGLISGYNWSVTTQPGAGAAAIDLNTAALFKFRPTLAGRYIVQLIPLDQNSNPTTATTISIWASTYLGAVGDWSCATCHDGFYMPDKITPWKGTLHATVMHRDLNGEHGDHISKSCMPCHAMGDYANTRGDGNFYDVAQSIGFDLNLIATWSKDAVQNGTDHWNDLPAALQTVSNVQCESCHGPGKTHNGDPSRISVPSYDSSICISCHDGPPHHIHPYEWRSSKHFSSNLLANGGVQNGECNKCHTAEGFVAKQVHGNSDIDPELVTRSQISCIGCHDPHDATNPHQLRKVSPVTLPNGKVFNFGLGNLCANCHNSRIADPNAAIDLVKGNSRGAHHGPQSDLLLGTSAYDWGQSYPAGFSPHYLAVEEGCVQCHMAERTGADVSNPAPVGGHTWEINDPISGANTVETACAGCHEGLTTTDRVPITPRDFDGNGAAEGVQTEFSGLLENLKAQLLNRLHGSSYDPVALRITISTADWKKLTLDQRGALYNFNLVSEDRSKGVHNTKYTIAVIQRSYLYLTKKRYNQDFPGAYMVDNSKNSVPIVDWHIYP